MTFPTGISRAWQRISKSLHQTSVNTVELYNGTKPQTLNIHNFMTGNAYECVSLAWSGNAFNITSLALNGTVRNINFPANVIYTFGAKDGNFIVDLTQNDVRVRSTNSSYAIHFGNKLIVTGGITHSGNLSGGAVAAYGSDGAGLYPWASSITFRKDLSGGNFELVSASQVANSAAPATSSITGGNAYSAATTYLSGGSINITGGVGASGSAGAANGGNVVLAGGTGYGTGTKGIVAASRLRANGFATATAAKTADYTATLDDGTIEVDASGAASTITLFACSANAGKIIVVKKIDSSANAVTVDGNASETIDGATTISLASQYSTAILQVNAAGTGWNKLSGV